VNLGFRLESRASKLAIWVATCRFVFGFGRDLLHWLRLEGPNVVDPFGFRRLDLQFEQG
jgi:hypothetical protein